MASPAEDAAMLRAVALASDAMLQRIMFPVFPIVLKIHSLPEFWEYFVISNWLCAAIVLGTAEWWIRSGSGVGFRRRRGGDSSGTTPPRFARLPS